jgi:HAMP domain-containing protein
LHPNDNQEMRRFLMSMLLGLRRFEEAVSVGESYPEGRFPETTYGPALALFRLGRMRAATERLRRAVSRLSLVARELAAAKPIRVPPEYPGREVMGGADQAYNYWRMDGGAWEKAAGALRWLRRILAGEGGR